MKFYGYVTTLQPPTAVQKSLKGNFLSPFETNLIVSSFICFGISILYHFNIAKEQE
ncbi:unnamed protein product [Cunninghamella blakesleeana]